MRLVRGRPQASAMLFNNRPAQSTGPRPMPFGFRGDERIEDGIETHGERNPQPRSATDTSTMPELV